MNKLFINSLIMNIEKIRRDNLHRYIMENFKNIRKFTIHYTVNYGNIYSMLKGERPFGERIARELETKIGLSAGFLDQEDALLSATNDKKIPIFNNKLSAGQGNKVFDEEIIGYHLLNINDLKNEGLEVKNLCVFFVRGDSMTPEIQDGSKVLVDTSQTTLTDNKIYAIAVDNEIFIKKIFKDLSSDKIILRSENNTYPDKIFKTTQELRVIGRVVYLLGKRL